MGPAGAPFRETGRQLAPAVARMAKVLSMFGSYRDQLVPLRETGRQDVKDIIGVWVVKGPAGAPKERLGRQWAPAAARMSKLLSMFGALRDQLVPL